MASADCAVPLRSLPSGEWRAFVAFAADRTTVLAVQLAQGGAPCALEPSGMWRTPALRARSRSLHLRIRWTGEPPQVAGVVALPADQANSGDAAHAALRADERRRCLELLDARARRRFERFSRETRFFLRFDAWTNPPVLSQLLDEEFHRELRGATRQLFGLSEEVRGEAPTAEQIVELSIGLMQRARERAERLACGEPVDPKPRRARAVAPTERQKFESVARFLYKLFRGRWPGTRSVATLEEIERAFALFAAGALAFVPLGETDAYRMKLNAEPDSAYFFAFAEFALQAIRLGVPQRADWFAFARLFVALEDVFVARYGAPLRRRDLDEQYLRQHRSARAPFELAELREHVQRYRELYPTVDQLDQLELAHTINVLHAARDEVAKSVQRRDDGKPRGAKRGRAAVDGDT